MKQSDSPIRHQFTVPVGDAMVNDWIALQNSSSDSLRTVIKDYIARHGMTDATFQPLSINDNNFACKNFVNTPPANEEKVVNEEPNDEISYANRNKTSQQINDELLAQLLK